MNVEECREKFPGKLREVTLVFLLKKDKILLAMKKRGFGVGKWNGVGGKTLPGETVEDAAVREASEEVGVVPKGLKKVALLDFFFPLIPQDYNWNQQVHVYFCKSWKGEIRESDEMKPKWFKLSKIPYTKMWEDDILWLPNVLTGKLVRGGFVFGEYDKIVDSSVSIVKELNI